VLEIPKYRSGQLVGIVGARVACGALDSTFWTGEAANKEAGWQAPGSVRLGGGAQAIGWGSRGTYKLRIT